jgi:trehalose 6-phosphate phosphatase
MRIDPLERARTLVRAVLATGPAGFVTDLDGTLAPIVGDPAAAALAPGAAAVLRRLAGRVAIVAVITGRAAADARRILEGAADELLVVGNHGLEWLEPGEAAPTVPEEATALRTSLEAALGRVPALPGVAIDDKGLSATIHYRAAADAPAARTALLGALGDLPEGMELREGRRSVELRPAGIGDKGSALTAIADRHRLGGLVVAGDDVTDLDMFRSARQLRGRGVATFAIVVSGGREVPMAVRDAADLAIGSPAGLVELLADVAASLPRRSRR